MELKNKIIKRLLFFLYIVLAFLYIIPMLQSVALSFAHPNEAVGYFESRPPLLPSSFSIEQYYDILIHNSYYVRMFWVTLFVSMISASLNVIISLMTSFVLAKSYFRFRSTIIFFYIIAMMMPFQVTLLPNYLMIKWLGLYDSIFALILPAIFNPFGTFFLVQIIKTVPNDAFEAAYMETNNPLIILLKMVVPQIKSGIAALFIIVFATSWNMVEQVLILTKRLELRTLGTAFNDIFTYNNSIAFAGCVIYMSPIICLYFLFEQEIGESFSSIRLNGIR